MKKLLPNILLASVFLIGLALLLYPAISNYVNTRHQSHAVASYENDIAKLAPEDYTPILQAAQAYNTTLLDNPDRFLQTDEEAATYQSLLNPTGNGIMGYVEISKIGVKLPIYHGTDESVLQVGAGHVEGTSLPVGGIGTHCAISGHRELPSAMLFTDLDKLVVGDQFAIHVLDQVLTYQIDQVLVVKPSELDSLEIDPAKDYCTLITCTPYGVNSHRLMLRGLRVENAAEQAPAEASAPTAEQTPYDATAGLIVIGILALVVILLVRSASRRKGE
jgi:sortase A